MALFTANRIGIRDCGHSVNVPDNDVARLMYYLSCVCNAVECDMTFEMRRLTNYQNWRSLSSNEIRKLIALCYVFSPDVFDNNVFFHSPALCGNSSNKFYEISQIRHQLLAVSSIVVGGQRKQVNSIMVYTKDWMRKNYAEPILRLAWRYSN